MHYGHTAGHVDMEMPLGMVVGRGQDHIVFVLDGDNSLKCRGFVPLKKKISGQF